MTNIADSEEHDSGLPPQIPESIVKRAGQLCALMQTNQQREGATQSFALSGDALGQLAYRHDPKLGETDRQKLDE